MIRLIIVFLALVISMPDTFACEELIELSSEEVKEYRDKLIQSNADPLDRLFAFENLACSSKPTIRAYAIREGLKSSSDPLVRHQILFEALMQRPRIDVELSDSKKLKPGDKKFIEEYSGVYSREVIHRNRDAGCISFDRGECRPTEAIFIRGGIVEFNRGRIVGRFELTDANELVGYIRPQAHPNYSNIPAIIKLD